MPKTRSIIFWTEIFICISIVFKNRITNLKQHLTVYLYILFHTFLA